LPFTPASRQRRPKIAQVIGASKPDLEAAKTMSSTADVDVIVFEIAFGSGFLEQLSLLHQ
jgi:hypothetical protein